MGDATSTRTIYGRPYDYDPGHAIKTFEGQIKDNWTRQRIFQI